MKIVSRLRSVRLTMADRLLATIVAGVIMGAVGSAVTLTGCSSEQKRVERGVVDAAAASCVILRGVIDNGMFDTICANAQELAPLVKDLFLARKRAAAKNGKIGASSAAHPDDLPPAPGSNVCELAQASGCACGPTATASTP